MTRSLGRRRMPLIAQSGRFKTSSLRGSPHPWRSQLLMGQWDLLRHDRVFAPEPFPPKSIVNRLVQIGDQTGIIRLPASHAPRVVTLKRQQSMLQPLICAPMHPAWCRCRASPRVFRGEDNGTRAGRYRNEPSSTRHEFVGGRCGRAGRGGPRPGLHVFERCWAVQALAGT